jgi:4-hydroxy-4-methyl-2-oxoglutarate aldolase
MRGHVNIDCTERLNVKITLVCAVVACAVTLLSGWVFLQPSGDPVVEGFRRVEVASVADAMEQLYGVRAYMGHQMRPVFTTKFAGPAVTMILKKEEHKQGPLPQVMDTLDTAPAGSVFVAVLPNGEDYSALGGLMATTLRARGVTGAVLDGSLRDLPQIKRMQFPVFSTGVVPSTAVNHYKFGGANVPVDCAGVRVNPNDIVTADEDGVVVVPKAHAAEVLKKAQELDEAEHSTYPFIEKYRSLRKAVEKFGRL